jgi:glycosyltransferase involved in cell wall biosynthesis
MLERAWLRAFARNADGFDVQTESMGLLLQEALNVRVPVVVMPFAASDLSLAPRNPERSQPTYERASFLYVATGEPHKNHARLVQAWVLLAQENLFPELVLTVDSEKFGYLCDILDAAVERHGLRVRKLGVVNADIVADLYAWSTALIYPSLLESFGLPLLEARAAGMPVLAAELDYVRDLIDPVESFDPLSPRSMARAVRRFLQIPLPRCEVMTPSAYLAYLKEAKV